MTAALHWLQCHGVVATPAALAQQAQPSYEYREDGRLVTVVDALQAQPEMPTRDTVIAALLSIYVPRDRVPTPYDEQRADAVLALLRRLRLI